MGLPPKVLGSLDSPSVDLQAVWALGEDASLRGG